MAIIFNVALGESDLSASLVGQDASQHSRTTDFTPHLRGFGNQELPEFVSDILSHKPREGFVQQNFLDINSGAHHAVGFLASDLQSDQVPIPGIYARMLSPRCILSPDEMNDIRAVGDICHVLRVRNEYDLFKRVIGFALDEEPGELGISTGFDPASSFLANRFRLEQETVPVNYAGFTETRRLSSFQMHHISSVDDVCEVLRIWGENDLANRIAYFASDEDLEDGDIPVTVDSARGFLSFFSAVKSEGRVSLTCSPEGWLCAVWRFPFPDERRASLWFLDADRVMFAATSATGEFIEIEGGGDVGNSRDVMEKLIQAGLLSWDLDTPNSGSFHPITTLPGTVANEILLKMGFLQKEHFSSARTGMNATFPLTGWNTSTPRTDDSRLTALFNL